MAILTRRPGGGGAGGGAVVDHINDTSDAHDATAISVADAGGLFTATEVEAALAELAALQRPIQEIIVPAGGQASLDFQNIPQTFRHLRLEGKVATERTSTAELFVRVNNDSGASYFYEILLGAGATASAAATSSATQGAIGRMGATAGGQFTSFTIRIPYYTLTTAGPANILSEYGAHVTPNNTRGSNLVLYNVTAAVSRLTFFSEGSVDIKEGSQLALYGEF